MHIDEGYLTMPDGVRVFYEVVGHGTPALVVPNGFVLRPDFPRLAAERALVCYDPRHRGRSDAHTDPKRVGRGVLNDVDDLEALRRHFGIQAMELVGHSYMGVVAVGYGLQYPEHLGRIVQIGPAEPPGGKAYPSHLTGADDTRRVVFTRLERLRAEREGKDSVEFCRRFWSVLRLLYVVDPADAHRVDWGRCELPNERASFRYWMETLLPSLKALDLASTGLAALRVPVLTIHGRRDRSAPYGGGREWAMLLPNARLLTVEDAGHAPWIEAPSVVFPAIDTFLHGEWPAGAEVVKTLDPGRP